LISSTTSLGDGSRNAPPFNDSTARIQRAILRQASGRFTREARVQRRWESLKTTAAQMQQVPLQ